ncbi:MAG TPA: DUF309 domain-containing protein [Thermoanaerobaculia bacterium]
MEIEADPRFVAALRQLEEGDWYDASEGFEELFFEAVRDEVEFVRLFLQVSVGLHHTERGQWRAAYERLEEGVRVLDGVTNPRGVDLAAFREQVTAAMACVMRRERPRIKVPRER